MYFNLLRVKHWIKNILLLFPLFFAGRMTELSLLKTTLIGILAFSLISSAFYVFNDLSDYRFDKRHPVKQFRPYAAGLVSKQHSLLIITILMVGGLLITFYLGFPFLFIVLLFCTLNLLYNLGLKKFAIADITILALGYVVRIYAGGILTHIRISEWLAIMIFLVALFLALSKRKHDLELHQKLNIPMRNAISGYTMPFVQSSLTYMAAIITVSYLMYTITMTDKISSNYPWFLLTFLPVIPGTLRYLQIINSDQFTGDPVKVLWKDRPLQGIIVIWIFLFTISLYG